jgi:FkbM family methyltransferase
MPTWEERLAHAKALGFSPRVIFDGGAFRGEWAREAARMFPGARLVLIEPNPFAREQIGRTIGKLQPAPTVLPFALGDSPGKAKLKLWGEEASDAGASLLDHVVGEPGRVFEVAVETLDAVSRQTSLLPDLVKLDLQGGELSALKGATRVLGHAEFMMVEFGCLEAYIGRSTPRDLLELMYANDYCLYDVVDLHYRPYDGALTGGDFFFVKNSSPLRRHKGWA